MSCLKKERKCKLSQLVELIKNFCQFLLGQGDWSLSEPEIAKIHDSRLPMEQNRTAKTFQWGILPAKQAGPVTSKQLHIRGGSWISRKKSLSFLTNGYLSSTCPHKQPN